MRARVLEGVALVAVLAAALASSIREITTPDAYFHVAAGRWMAEHDAVPRTDVWLASGRDRKLVDVEWLFQRWAAHAHDKQGPAGLVALQAVLAVAATALAHAVARQVAGECGSAATFAALGFVVCAAGRFNPTPDAVSLVLAGACLLVLEAREARPRLVLALPVLAALWGNLHGAFAPLAAGLTLAYGLGDLLKRRPAQARRLLLLFPVVALAPALGPYGLDQLAYPYRALLGHGPDLALMAEQIVEFRSPLFHPYGSTTFEARAFQAGAVLALAGLAVAVGRRRLEPGRAAAVVAVLLLGAQFTRAIGLFALVAMPLAGVEIVGLAIEKWRRASLAGPALAAAGGLVLAVLAGTGVRWRDSLEAVRPLRAGFADATHPGKAVEWALANGVEGPVWTDFSSGHYTIFAAHPRLRPEICGHVDLYEREKLRLYADALVGRASIADLAGPRDPPHRAFIVDHRRLAGSALLANLLASPDYGLAYADEAGAVFVRGRPDRDPVALLGAASFTSDAPEVEARERIAAATFLLEAGAPPEAARAHAERAAALEPGFAPVEVVLGKVAQAEGDLDAAKAHFRRALADAPRAAEVRAALGQIHLRLGELGRAEEELRAAVEIEPRNDFYRELLRAFYLTAGDEAKASALAAPPLADPAARRARASGLVSLGVRREREGRSADAERLYREAIALAPDLALAHYDLGLLLRDTGRKDDARRSLERAAALAPDDPDIRKALEGLR